MTTKYTKASFNEHLVVLKNIKINVQHHSLQVVCFFNVVKHLISGICFIVILFPYLFPLFSWIKVKDSSKPVSTVKQS